LNVAHTCLFRSSPIRDIWIFLRPIIRASTVLNISTRSQQTQQIKSWKDRPTSPSKFAQTPHRRAKFTQRCTVYSVHSSYFTASLHLHTANARLHVRVRQKLSELSEFTRVNPQQCNKVINLSRWRDLKENWRRYKHLELESA